MGKQYKTVSIWSISIFVFLFLISFSITSNKAKAANAGEFIYFNIDTELDVRNDKDVSHKVTVNWSCASGLTGSITDNTPSESTNALDGVIYVASASKENTDAGCTFGASKTIRASVSLDGWVTRTWTVALPASTANPFQTGASMDYTIVVNGVSDELGTALTFDGTNASASYDGTVASQSYNGTKLYIAGSTSGGKVHAYQNGYVRSSTATALTIGATASESVDFGVTGTTSTHNESGLPFAHKILVTLDGGAVVTEGVVTAGDSYDVTCTYSTGGYWYCAVPLAETGTTARHVHDNWNTDTATYTDRTTKAASQTTATIYTTRKAPAGGGESNPTPTPTPSPETSVSPTPTPSVSVTPTPTVTITPTPSVSVAPSVIKLYRKVNDPKVYVQQSDGTLSWVKTLQDFNVAGYKWSDVKLISGSEFAQMKIGGKVKVVKGIKWLNVRDSASTRGKIIGKVLPNESYDFSSASNGWYKIKKGGSDFGWVFGGYVSEI